MADGNPIIDLYRSMAKSSDPEVKNFAVRTSFNDFSNKLINDKSFRDELYYGLSNRGLTDLDPVRWEQSLGLYKGESPLQYMAGDSQMREQESAEPLQEVAEEGPKPEEDKSWLQKGADMAIGAVNFAKDLWQGLGTASLQADVINELTKNVGTIDQAFFDSGKNPNLIDFNAVADLNRKIRERGETATEKEFYDSSTRDTSSWVKMLALAGAQSYATLVKSGWGTILGSGAAGAGGGALAGGGVLSLPGAIAAGSTGLSVGTAKAAADMEYMLSIMDGLNERKIDITDPNALRKAWGNKKLMDPIRAEALEGTAIVMGADLLGVAALKRMAKARKIAETAKKIANPSWKKSAFSKVKDKIVDVAIEGTAGSSGELTKKLATKEGPLTEKDYLEVAIEGGAEIPIIGTIANPITSRGEKFINNQLDKLINPSASATPPTAAAQPAPEATAPTGNAAAARGTEETGVTQEEFDDFVQNNKISEGRAFAVAEDAQLAMTNPKHMEDLMSRDPLYAGMVEKFIEKSIGQAEVETLTETAYEDVGRLYGMTREELMNAVNQDHPSYNKEIADTFNNTFNRLFQSYREANDSKDISGVSGQVREGQESQQAQPQQGGGAQETGGGGVLQAPQGTVAQVGQVVQIDGKRYYVKDEGGGKLVVETDEGKIYEIPSDNPTIESIGATLLREAQPDKNYGIQVNNNDTATINGEKYTILRDNKGNVIGARNQRRSNVTLNKAEVLGELQRQLSDPKLRQLTTVAVQQPLTQINEPVQPEGAAPVAEPAQPQPVSPEMAGQPVQEGGEAAGVMQPGTEAGAQAVGAPVSGITEAAPQIEQAPVAPVPAAPQIEQAPGAPAPAAPAPAAPEALPSFEEYDSNFKGEGLKRGQRMQNKQEFSNKYGAEVYEGMRKINDNFTRITDALIKEGRLNKKC
jgi:hypothetical protein